ncbi:hypothetical protein G6F57_023285 [Rhizopus arrhizus]|nr:hypothetical protein G6F57_023285 [Rhizopus arrhizus]
MRGSTDAAGQTDGHRHRHDRPRHEGRRAGGPARAGAHRRHGAVFRGRHAFVVPAGAGVQEPFWCRQ